jgi:hypothetical protein
LTTFYFQEQIDAVFKLIRKLPALVNYYLQQHVFPTVLYHHTFNLSASGQELGGDILFGRRLGFSGTPSDLLPLELVRRLCRVFLLSDIM